MECYYHLSNQACGICKSCQRGICRECATEVTNGLACKDRCEKEAEHINDLLCNSIDINNKSSVIVNSVALGAGDIFNVLLGGLFVGWGYYESVHFIMYMGAAFTVFGLFGVYRVIKAKYHA